MQSKITRDILESYLRCKYKSHLKLSGHRGDKSEYEALLTDLGSELRLKIIDKILVGLEHKEAPKNVSLTVSALEQGPPFFLDAILEEDSVSLSFDGLKRVGGLSKLGNFHYVPMLFDAPRKLGKEQRVLLEVFGLLLSRIQGKSPAYGILWHGKECTPTRIKLSARLRTGEQTIAR
jgi:hypothetical protein